MARVIGLGTVPKVDDDDSGSVFTSVTTVISVQRPSRVRERVENTALEDTLATEAAGIEIAGDSVIEIYSDPGSTQDNLIGTLLANRTQCLWQYLYSDSGTETFDAIVMAYEPMPIVRNEHQKARITLARQGASTFA
jgi:hypothetical protein